jgi:hypothetical protein
MELHMGDVSEEKLDRNAEIYLRRKSGEGPNYGESFEFYAQGAGEVVPVMQGRHRFGGDTERSFMRRSAMEMCEWSGKNYYFHSRDALAESMIENGLLEVID